MVVIAFMEAQYVVTLPPHLMLNQSTSMSRGDLTTEENVEPSDLSNQLSEMLLYASIVCKF